MGETPPKWFLKDYKEEKSWGFFCKGEGPDEESALKVSETQCASKICMLFGVEVESTTKTQEDLKGLSVSNTIIEKCPNVRVKGRVNLRKSINCDEPKVCISYIEQIYPLSEYEIEFNRLNQPKVLEKLEKEIIIREGNNTFKDPKKCLQGLSAALKIKNRVDLIKNLKELIPLCQNLDYRNVDLQKELNSHLSNFKDDKSNSGKMALLKILEESRTFEQSLKDLISFEEKQLKYRSNEKMLVENLQKSFYAFFPKNIKAKTNEEVPDELDGKITKELYNTPYMHELYTCRESIKIMGIFPLDWDTDLKICVTHPDNGNQDCEYFDPMILKFQFLNCLCRKDYENFSQKCTDFILNTFEKVCTNSSVFDLACKQKIKKELEKSEFKLINTRL